MRSDRKAPGQTDVGGCWPSGLEARACSFRAPDPGRPPAGTVPVFDRPRSQCDQIGKHQVKRMLEVVGHPVLKLERVRFGPLTLGDLPPGQFRFLTDREANAIRSESTRSNGCWRLLAIRS